MKNFDKIMAVLDKRKISYLRSGEKTLFITPGICKNIGHMEITASFDVDRPGDVQFCVSHLGKFTKNKQTVGMATCNALNEKYRWVNFHINSDNEGCARCDSILYGSSADKEFLKMLACIVQIVDDAYPDLMDALYC